MFNTLPYYGPHITLKPDNIDRFMPGITGKTNHIHVYFKYIGQYTVE